MVKTILVTGATGKQGGAVINALLDPASDVEILAVTRDSNSSSAQKLASKSSQIKLVQGNLDEPSGIFENAAEVASGPIWGVFSVQVPMGSGGVAGEERQGKALIDEALRNNVQHFVYTSVDRGGDKSFDSPTMVPHFISKHNIEHHLVEKAKGTQMSWTILRPVAFCDNLVPGFMGKAFATMWKISLKEKPLQVIATSDIGFFVALAFKNPEQYKNKAISLAGDELTFEQLGKVFEERTGQPLQLTYEFVCSGFMYMVKDIGLMFQWFYDVGYGVDIGELKKQHPGLKDFGTWLEKESQFSTQ